MLKYKKACRKIITCFGNPSLRASGMNVDPAAFKEQEERFQEDAWEESIVAYLEYHDGVTTAEILENVLEYPNKAGLTQGSKFERSPCRPVLHRCCNHTVNF